MLHRIALSLLRGLAALALSGGIVFVGEIAVSRSFDLALERSADRTVRSAVRTVPASRSGFGL